MRNRMMPAILLTAVVGCVPDAGPAPTGALATANRAITAGQSDQAIAATQDYLRATPYGPGAAEAWYLQGRGFEQKASKNQMSAGQVRSTLHEARSCYIESLGQNPRVDLEADVHTSFSNVAFFQDDFPTAIEQAAMGMKMTSSTDVKAFLLYRTGVCQQRLERFNDADQTYRQVVQRYPGTSVAESARSREGLHQFYLQLGTYADAPAADRIILSQQASGYVMSRENSRDRFVVSVGPFSTYEDARRAKERFEGQFPAAVVLP